MTGPGPLARIGRDEPRNALASEVGQTPSSLAIPTESEPAVAQALASNPTAAPGLPKRPSLAMRMVQSTRLPLAGSMVTGQPG